MALKEGLLNSWRYLPGLSLLAFDERTAEYGMSFKEELKGLGHLIYCGSAFVYLMISMLLGTPNVFRWLEGRQRLIEKGRKYECLLERVVQRADQDDKKGLSIVEAADLYRRAGYNFDSKIDDSGRVSLSALPDKIPYSDLEKALRSYESEAAKPK